MYFGKVQAGERTLTRLEGGSRGAFLATMRHTSSPIDRIKSRALLVSTMPG